MRRFTNFDSTLIQQFIDRVTIPCAISRRDVRTDIRGLPRFIGKRNLIPSNGFPYERQFLHLFLGRRILVAPLGVVVEVVLFAAIVWLVLALVLVLAWLLLEGPSLLLALPKRGFFGSSSLLRLSLPF